MRASVVRQALQKRSNGKAGQASLPLTQDGHGVVVGQATTTTWIAR